MVMPGNRDRGSERPALGLALALPRSRAGLSLTPPPSAAHQSVDEIEEEGKLGIGSRLGLRRLVVCGAQLFALLPVQGLFTACRIGGGLVPQHRGLAVFALAAHAGSDALIKERVNAQPHVPPPRKLVEAHAAIAAQVELPHDGRVLLRQQLFAHLLAEVPQLLAVNEVVCWKIAEPLAAKLLSNVQRVMVNTFASS